MNRFVPYPNSSVSRALNAKFHSAHFQYRAKMPASFAAIFFDPSSMTKIITELSRDRLKLEVLDHCWQKPYPTEKAQLPTSQDWGIGREVVMYGAKEAWLYGRTFFPESVVKAYGNVFAGLGSRPLGEVLFSSPLVRRSHFTVACLLPGHSEYKNASQALKQSPDYFWARQSLFYLPSGAITLMEVFSPLMEKASAKRAVKK